MTTIDVIMKAFQNEESLNFEGIFSFLEKEFKPLWEQEATTKNITYENLLVKKRGEVYKLLTIHGDFVKLKENKWTTYKLKMENSL
ncbi:DNA-directed RNA polymerase subunit delta [[Mycoplasma] mobile]|uniref:Expressed protein n=1 Tax=Mycoplasma mobile (strain ATCC 43663 / 163K / NCTC 11711) TaxID=267748 RepID=Q6KIG5_MYCM1|nr:hypothetical protein [[Mycoplasma] mobile]AAT27611.1 expressed protein [Mycoplasma mobile 163K]